MDDIFEELYYQFVYLPKKDACPERTARWEPFFHGAPLVYNASLTGFQEGFRLGLRLGLALPPPEDLQL